MDKIYNQHDRAFAGVSAYAICKDGRKVGTIAIKYPRDGAGRLYAYVHAHGFRMVRGSASGYGYSKADYSKADAAVSSAAHAMEPDDDNSRAIKAALLPDDGSSFEHHLLAAGFSVLQAV